MRYFLFIAILISVSSCRMDDDCEGAEPKAPPYLQFSFTDIDGNNLVFGENAKYSFDSMELFEHFSGNKSEANLDVDIRGVGDTVLQFRVYRPSFYTLSYNNGTWIDTIEFINTRTDQGRCFSTLYYDVYYNKQLKLQEFSSIDTDKPISIIK